MLKTIYMILKSVMYAGDVISLRGNVTYLYVMIIFIYLFNEI